MASPSPSLEAYEDEDNNGDSDDDGYEYTSSFGNDEMIA